MASGICRKKIPLKANFVYRKETNENTDNGQMKDKAKSIEEECVRRLHSSTPAWKTFLRTMYPSTFLKREVKINLAATKHIQKRADS